MQRKSKSVPIILWQISQKDLLQKTDMVINQAAAAIHAQKRIFKSMIFDTTKTFSDIHKIIQAHHTGVLCVELDALSAANRTELKNWVWNFQEQTTAMNGAWYVIVVTDQQNTSFPTINQFVQILSVHDMSKIVQAFVQTAIFSCHHRQIEITWQSPRIVANPDLQKDLNAYQKSPAGDTRNMIFYGLKETLLHLRQHRGIPLPKQHVNQIDGIVTSLPTMPKQQKSPATKLYMTQDDASDDQLWEFLARDLLYAAERIWKDPLLSPITEPELETFTTRLLSAQRSATYSKRLLFWWLEAHLYFLRSTYNIQIYENISTSPLNIRQEVNDLIKQLLEILGTWNKECHAIIHNAASQEHQSINDHWFTFNEADISYIESLAQEFGVGSLGEDELGWAAYARSTSNELLYHYKELFLFRTKRQNSNSAFLLSFFLWASTGFGFRLGRFFALIISLTVVFALLYTIGAQFSGASCTIQSTIPDILHATFTNVAGFATVPHNCSALTNFTAIVEPFIGYFLLATLAAILAEVLINAER